MSKVWKAVYVEEDLAGFVDDDLQKYIKEFNDANPDADLDMDVGWESIQDEE